MLIFVFHFNQFFPSIPFKLLSFSNHNSFSHKQQIKHLLCSGNILLPHQKSVNIIGNLFSYQHNESNFALATTAFNVEWGVCVGDIH